MYLDTATVSPIQFLEEFLFSLVLYNIDEIVSNIKNETFIVLKNFLKNESSAKKVANNLWKNVSNKLYTWIQPLYHQYNF